MKRFLPLLAALLATLPAPAQTLVTIGTKADTTATYSVVANGQPTENLRQVQLVITQVSDSEAAKSTATTTTTLRTGKQKTVGQVTAQLLGVMNAFVAGAAPGTSLGKLGSLEKGGEVEFVAESPDVLRFDFKTPGDPMANSKFSKAEAMIFAEILAGK